MTRKEFKEWISKVEKEIETTTAEALYKGWDVNRHCIFFIEEAIDYLEKAKSELDRKN